MSNATRDTRPATSTRPIGDYAIIGDCRSAALISTAGSIDWLCWPCFDSASVFGALLDVRRGGRFVVSPVNTVDVTRRYVPDTAVLETTFRTPTGVLQLTDLMPVATDEDRRGELRPGHEILRHTRCLEGEVELEILFDPRFDYGQVTPQIIHQRGFGLFCEHGSAVLTIRSDVRLSVHQDRPGASGRATLRAGDERAVSLTYDRHIPAVLPPASTAAARVAATVQWWRGWMSMCGYDGPYRALVRRSAVTLKLLTYAPSGAIVAAPTTSLPEDPGGVRNWDYRYCWLRDASLTLRALLTLGYRLEGEAFLSWMLHATHLTWPDLQILYDVYGEVRLPERTLDHLEGYARSTPVRVGNAAIDQLQTDIYGEVLDAAWTFVEQGGHLDRATRRLLVGLGDTIVRRWCDADEGIWEPRAGRQHHTHSKAMCWIGLDRLVRLCERGDAPAEAALFAGERDAIRRTIETRGFNERLGSYVSVLDGDTVDASLLLLALMGYTDAKSARMRTTAALIRDRLGTDGLLYRYRGEWDGLRGGEGAFAICSFWSAAHRGLEGDVETARREFEHVSSFANDVGLMAEEIDPVSGAALGNFPQAFSHVGLINAAIAIDKGAV